MAKELCWYDEAYDMDDAYEIGWCMKCTIKECPRNKKKK